MKRPTVDTTEVSGGRKICTCHGWSVRLILRRNGQREWIHCEHPKAYIEYGDGYIPDYCQACLWRA